MNIVYQTNPAGYELIIYDTCLRIKNTRGLTRTKYKIIPLSKIHSFEWESDKVRINDEEILMGRFTEDFVNALLPLIK